MQITYLLCPRQRGSAERKFLCIIVMAEDVMGPRHRYIAIVIGLGFAAILPAVAAPINWTRYQIAETGAAVDIPSSIFSEEAGKPEAGFGGRWLTSDRRADLTVQSIANDAGLSPAVFLARKNPPPGIVYKRVTPGFFVVSSFRNGKIWYDRCNFAGRFINCVLINYPAAEKRQWDSVVTRISNTLASR